MKRRADHTTFYCPNGHGQSFKAATEAEQLRKQLAVANSNTTYWKEQHGREERSKIALKGQLTKMKRRAVGGACPCCKRTFSALAKHMKTKHPNYAKEA